MHLNPPPFTLQLLFIEIRKTTSDDKEMPGVFALGYEFNLLLKQVEIHLSK
jgi:hypothetical protein